MRATQFTQYFHMIKYSLKCIKLNVRVRKNRNASVHSLCNPGEKCVFDMRFA